MQKQDLILKLNDINIENRLSALKELKSNFVLREGTKPYFVNNHIHTTYSFSPYSPTFAAYTAYISGLETAGIMDHDSIGGADEFLQAGKILGLPVTVGVETRVSFKGMPFSDRLINNPDQKGIAYMALHGIAFTQFEKVKEYFAPLQAKRNLRNKKMSQKIDALIRPHGMSFDFEKDVLPNSLYKNGGTVTERTLCYALALKITEKFGKGQAAISFLSQKLGLTISQKQNELLSDLENPHYIYDLLGILKGGLVSKFYIDADDECPPVDEFLRFGKSIGAITAYAYLGDVAESVTGDKKAQKFEDDYLDELFEFLKASGFNAVAYMPSRNNGKQLERLRGLCKECGLFEISGEDINSSRQSFICKQLENKEFSHLIEATWALIGHEKQAAIDIERGMFSQKTLSNMPLLEDRIKYFAKIGRN